MSKITVIITAHQDRGWIDDAILSAKNQTFSDYDIILTSDGNPSLAKFAKKHSIKFCYTKKGNWGTAVNNAVKTVRSEWIKVLHDDDLLKPNCLGDLYNSRGDASLVYANVEIFTESSSRIYKPPARIELKDMLLNNPINWAGVMFKRDALTEVGGFDPLLQFANDKGLYLSMLSADHKFVYCDKVVASFRKHDTQLTGHQPEARRKDLIYLSNKYK